MQQEEVHINKIREAFRLFKKELEAVIDKLDPIDRVSVERLPSLDGYQLTHTRGIYGLLYNGSVYHRSDENKGNALILKEDLLIGVASIIRFLDNPAADVDKYNMMPAEYAELAVKTLSGINIYNYRPEYERKITPVRTELFDEERGIWRYLTTFLIPKDFFEESLTK